MDTDHSLMHNFKESNSSSILTKKVIMLLVIMILFGVGTGYLLASNGGFDGTSSVTTKSGSVDPSEIEKGIVVGTNDTETFKDTAEGELAEGGIDGEGQFHLVRPGGESQNVYLTSSLVDLSQFVGRKVKVWGQTHAAEKAGWLMDVGRVEVLE